MKYQEIKKIANEILSKFMETSEKAIIGGSIRRKSKNCKDIEIICIPKTTLKKSTINTLFETITETKQIRHPKFIFNLVKFKIIKGKPLTGKYIQLTYQNKIQVDVFTATEQNYGYISILRTGSKNYSKFIINKLKYFGYKLKNGNIFKGTVLINVPDEKSLFELINENYTEPENRN